MAHKLRFHTEVQAGNINSVQQLIVQGGFNPNDNYLGVFPMDHAVEGGNVDMFCMLLVAGGDPHRKGNGANRKSAFMLATELSKDKKDARHEAAKTMLKHFEDKDARQKHFDVLQDRIFKKNQEDLKLIKKIFFGFVVFGLPALYYAIFVYKVFDMLGGKDEL